MTNKIMSNHKPSNDRLTSRIKVVALKKKKKKEENTACPNDGGSSSWWFSVTRMQGQECTAEPMTLLALSSYIKHPRR